MTGTLVGSMAGVCCLLATFLLHKRPNALFGLLLVCLLIGPLGTVDIGVKRIPLLAVDLYLPSWLLVAICFPHQWHMPRYVKQAIFALSAFVVTATLTSALYAPDGMKALWTLKNYLEGLTALYLIGTSLRTRPHLQTAATSLYVFGAAMVIELIAVSYQTAGGHLWAGLAQSKNLARTTFGQSNYVAGFLILAMPFAMVSLRRSSLHRLCAGAAFVLLVLGLVITASRGAMLSIAVVAAFALIRQPKRLLIGFLVVLALAAIALSAVPEEFVSSLQESFSRLNADPNTLQRLAVWGTSWTVFLDHPVLGIGLKASGFEFLANVGVAYHTDAHNFVLTLLCETGLFGTTFYLMAMWGCFRGGLRALASCSLPADRLLIRGCLLGVCASTLHSLVEILHGAAEYSVLIWSVLGLAACAPEILREASPALGEPGAGDWSAAALASIAVVPNDELIS